MSKHKALELADVMDFLSATQRNSDNAAGRAAAELRRQHALIVQMRDALRSVLTHEDFAMDARVATKAEATVTAANEYLEQP